MFHVQWEQEGGCEVGFVGETEKAVFTKTW